MVGQVTSCLWPPGRQPYLVVGGRGEVVLPNPFVRLVVRVARLISDRCGALPSPLFLSSYPFPLPPPLGRWRGCFLFQPRPLPFF